MSEFHSLLGVPNWVAVSFPIVQAVLVGIMAICCVLIIIGILVSPPQTGIGSNAITGASESYYTKNKGKNNAGRIRMLIIVCASIIALCSILYFVTYGVFRIVE